MIGQGSVPIVIAFSALVSVVKRAWSTSLVALLEWILAASLTPPRCSLLFGDSGDAVAGFAYDSMGGGSYVISLLDVAGVTGEQSEQSEWFSPTPQGCSR